jgi:hypothetical protein
VLGGSAAQEGIWRHVLTALAGHFGVRGQPISIKRQCVDPRLQWGQAGNLWHNAAIRSLAYALARPFRTPKG